MGSLTAAQNDAIAWSDVGPSPYGNDYQPVMAIANNHIHFLDVPNVPAGSADIFVIHCEFYTSYNYEFVPTYFPRLVSFFQPQPQAYPISGGSETIPATHGQATSFFQPSTVRGLDTLDLHFF